MENQANPRILTDKKEIYRVLSYFNNRHALWRDGDFDGYFDNLMAAIANNPDTTFIKLLDSDFSRDEYTNLAQTEMPGRVGSKFIGIDSRGWRVLVIKGEGTSNIVIYENHVPESDENPAVWANAGFEYRDVVPIGLLSKSDFLACKGLPLRLKMQREYQG